LIKISTRGGIKVDEDNGFSFPLTKESPIKDKASGLSIASKIVGITGFVLAWIPLIGILLGWILGPLALVMGGISLTQAKPENVKSKELAMVGIIIGLLTIAIKTIPFIKWL
jgi:hypothetical protein